MSAVLVTGAYGFIGRHVCAALERRPDVELRRAGRDTPRESLLADAASADVIVHLAGANRPPDPADFTRVNAELTEALCAAAAAGGRRPVLVLASSVHAAGDTAYGASKRRAEDAVRSWAEAGGGHGVAFRLSNVFGKWCRPGYNSAVATFCHSIANGLAYEVHDPERVVPLVYVDDVVESLLAVIAAPADDAFRMCGVEPIHRVRLGDVVTRLLAFRASRTTLEVPDFADDFTAKLYPTFLSYLPTDAFAYELTQRTDPRGTLAEFVKQPGFGQIFVSRTHPGITRGNHFHHSKTEKFLVLEGSAVVRFRRIDDDRVIEYPVRGEDFRVVDIPPGYTHSIENVGDREMVVLFWSSEIFDPTRPDTYADAVLNAEAAHA